MRVLVIEDDEEMARGGRGRACVTPGWRSMSRSTVRSGSQRALVNDYDVIVLDRDLPGLHGDQVCARFVASECRSRVLMLTAAASNEDLVDGLGLGADDYLPKPFDFPVWSRGSGRSRAGPTRPRPPVLTPRRRDGRHGTAARVPGGQSARAGPQGIRRARVAARLARAAASRPRSCSRAYGTRRRIRSRSTVKITISRLRAKLGDPPVIETVAKAGYRI